LIIAGVFAAMKARVAYYASTQWSLCDDARAVGRVVGLLDTCAFWLSIILACAAFAYIANRTIPASFHAGYRRELRIFTLLCTAAAAALAVSVVSDGARAANESPRGSKFIINGEPTENKLAVGTKGILRIDIQAHGKAAHSAYPHFGDSAIDKLLDILAELRALDLPSDPALGPATLNVGVISGGRAANVIPDQAAAQVLVRTVSETQALREKIEALLRGRCEYQVVRDTPALHLEALHGFETDLVAFTTDLSTLTNWGKRVLLGPGSIRVAHTPEERVAKADLLKAVDLYCRLVTQLKSV